MFFLTTCSESDILCVSRPAHDISLEEFDDEDLSEITDDCGIGLNYDSDPYEKVKLCFSVLLESFHFAIGLIVIIPRKNSLAACYFSTTDALGAPVIY